MKRVVIKFKSGKEFKAWLSKNKDTPEGIWIRFFRKDSGMPTITYAEALDEALCQGWIDAQVNSYDSVSWIQRYLPRRAKSNWSKRNTLHARRLIKEGRMRAAGLKQIEAAKKDGRWQSAYDSPKNAKPPADFLKRLGKNKKAKAFFAKLNRANLYAIVYRLQTAKKPETREKRLKAILEMLENGKTFHPQSDV